MISVRVLVIYVITIPFLRAQIEQLDSTTVTDIKALLSEEIEDKIDHQIPPFDFYTHSGEWVNSDSLQYDHSMIFLWHWSCQPCLDMFGDLERLHEEFENSVNFIAVTSGDIVVSEDYIRTRPLPFAVVTNAKPYITELGIKRLPKILLIKGNRLVKILNFRDENGEIVDHDKLKTEFLTVFSDN